MQIDRDRTVRPEDDLQPPVVHSQHPAKRASSRKAHKLPQQPPHPIQHSIGTAYTASCFLSSCFLPATFLQTLCVSCCVVCDI